MTPELTSSVRGLLSKRTDCDARVAQLDCIELEQAAGQPLFLDLRPPSLFARGFIPGSINTSSPDCLQLLSRLPEFSGQSCYVIAASAVNRHAARNSLGSYPGIRVVGWLRPEIVRQWGRRRGGLGSLEELEPDRVAIRVAAWKTVVLDVRDRQSFAAGHIPDALHISLPTLRGSIAGLPQETSLSVVCEAGDRAGFAASLLWKMGFTNLAILRGGFKAYAERGLPVARHSIPPVN